VAGFRRCATNTRVWSAPHFLKVIVTQSFPDSTACFSAFIWLGTTFIIQFKFPLIPSDNCVRSPEAPVIIRSDSDCVSMMYDLLHLAASPSYLPQ